jgi:PAS domain S-box-containing protein
LNKDLNQAGSKAQVHADVSCSVPGSLPGDTTVIKALQLQHVELAMQNEELRGAQLALALSRDRYVRLYDLAPVGFVTIDAAGHILEANHAAGLVLLGEREGLVGKRLAQFVAHDDATALREYMVQLFEAGEKRMVQLRMMAAGGALRSVRIEGICVGAGPGEPNVALLVLIDTTQEQEARRVDERTRKLVKTLEELQRERAQLENMQEALRISETKYRGMAENTRDILYAIDAKGNITYIGPQVARYGFSFERIMGRHFAEFVAPEDQERIRREIVRAASTGEPMMSDFRIRDTQNNVYWFEENSKAQVNDDGVILGFTGVLRDITERRRMEENQLRQQERLRRLAAKLASAQDQEQRRIAEGFHDDVAQNLIACDLKLSRLCSDAYPPEVSALVEDARRMLKSGMEKTRALTFELVSSTLLRLGVEEALAELCDDMTARYDVQFVFARDAHPKPLSQEAAIILFKCARELLFNVVKHASVKEARISVRRVNAEIHIMVEDRGKGFEHDMNAEARDSGDGLGLFSIRERIADLGGKLEIRSVPGVHTCVTIRAPLEKGHDAKQTTETHSLTPR